MIDLRRQVFPPVVLLCIFGLLPGCESISPLSKVNAQQTVIDDLNFEVPKDRPVTRQDDPVGSAQPNNGLNAPIIVSESGQGQLAPSQAAVDEGEAIYKVNFDNADLR